MPRMTSELPMLCAGWYPEAGVAWYAWGVSQYTI